MSKKFQEIMANNKRNNRLNKAKNSAFPKALKINKKSQNSAEQIANEFNSFYTNVDPSLRKIFRQSQQVLQNV